jgi:hypothetical protein
MLSVRYVRFETQMAFVSAGFGAAAVSAAADTTRPVLLELRRYQLRNSADNQRERMTGFLRQQSATPQRAGAGPAGVFASSIAHGTPFLLKLASDSSFAAIEEC